MGVGAGLYMCDVVVKSSRSLSHLLMSSCNNSRSQTAVASLHPIQLGVWESYIVGVHRSPGFGPESERSFWGRLRLRVRTMRVTMKILLVHYCTLLCTFYQKKITFTLHSSWNTQSVSSYHTRRSGVGVRVLVLYGRSQSPTKNKDSTSLLSILYQIYWKLRKVK